jgi:tetratricopeptide (TPR) repeat protein
MKVAQTLLLMLLLLSISHAQATLSCSVPDGQGNAAKLSALEICLQSDPDNLRYGSQYRQLAIEAKEFDRSIKFLESLTAAHPNAGNAALNFGFAYVDKIPIAGSISQVILANNALTQFSRAVELQPTWLAYYTRGNSYLFWPKVFNRVPLGMADLERALKLQSGDSKHSYYVRTYIALGDGYWKLDNLPKAREMWREGLRQFPGNAALQQRLALRGAKLDELLAAQFDPDRRVNTDLSELWASQ